MAVLKSKKDFRFEVDGKEIGFDPVPDQTSVSLTLGAKDNQSRSPVDVIKEMAQTSGMSMSQAAAGLAAMARVGGSVAAGMKRAADQSFEMEKSLAEIAALDKLSAPIQNEMSVLDLVGEALRNNPNLPVPFCECEFVAKINQKNEPARGLQIIDIVCGCGRTELEFLIPDGVNDDSGNSFEFLSVAKPTNLRPNQPQFPPFITDRGKTVTQSAIMNQRDINRAFAVPKNMVVSVDPASPDSERTGVAIVAKQKTNPTEKGILIHGGHRKNRHVDF